MRHKFVVGLTLASFLLTGCVNINLPSSKKNGNSASNGSGSTSSQTDTSSGSGSSSSQTNNNQKPSSGVVANDVRILQNVVDNAGNNEGCYTAWEELLNAVFTQQNNSFTLDSEGEYYLYRDNASNTFVEKDDIYDFSRDNVFVSGDQTMNIDLEDLDDSYQNLIDGYGVFTLYQNDATITVDATLTSDDDERLIGSIDSVEQSGKEEVASAAVNSMIDSIINYGYIRNVDPIHNASLYNYDLTQQGSGYVLKCTVKNLDEFKQQATVKTELYDYKTQSNVLGLDQIEHEEWTFTFDSNGMLKKVINNILHAVSALDQKTYVNVTNKTDVRAAANKDLYPSSFTSFFDQVKTGTLNKGSNFTVNNWKD